MIKIGEDFVFINNGVVEDVFNNGMFVSYFLLVEM